MDDKLAMLELIKLAATLFALGVLALGVVAVSFGFYLEWTSARRKKAQERELREVQSGAAEEDRKLRQEPRPIQEIGMQNGYGVGYEQPGSDLAKILADAGYNRRKIRKQYTEWDHKD